MKIKHELGHSSLDTVMHVTLGVAVAFAIGFAVVGPDLLLLVS